MYGAELQRQLLDCIPQGVAVFELENPGDDASLRLVFANAAASAQMGIDVASAIGQKLIDVLPGISAERLRFYAEVCRSRVRRDGERTLYRDPRVEDSSFSFDAIPVGIRGVAVVFENVTAQRKARAELMRLNRFLDSVIEHIPAMIFIKDARELRFERCNRACEELLGLPRGELLGKTDYDFFPKEQADFFVEKDRAVLREKELADILEEPIRTAHGTRWLHTKKIPLLDERGEAAHLLGISLDITERKQAEAVLRSSHEELERRVTERTAELRQQIEERLRAEQALARTEEQLRQAQKMEAIGQLAGGIAHDFNNLLSVVLTYCEVLLQRMSSLDRHRTPIEEIQRAGLRAADLTRQLLAFSRQQVLQPRTLDLREVVRGLEGMLSRVLGEDIELTIRTADDLFKIKADPSQIEQVVLNLVVNARDAMPRGGRLTIETRNVKTDANAPSEPDAPSYDQVLLSVADDGLGMSKETVSRIFEPFFTTKEKGKGTGLGLSTVFGIVKQSGGSIAVESAPGKGTCFKILLPATDDPFVSEAPDTSYAPEQLRGAETILLVEDDEQVRALTASILRGHGYRLLESGRPSEALAIVERHDGPIDLLLTDVVMPEMGGGALAEQLIAKRPSLRVLFMSGYTDDAVVRHGVLESGVAFVQKPLTPAVLARCVRQALDAVMPSVRPPLHPNAA